jgi:hypothetical protein
MKVCSMVPSIVAIDRVDVPMPDRVALWFAGTDPYNGDTALI